MTAMVSNMISLANKLIIFSIFCGVLLSVSLCRAEEYTLNDLYLTALQNSENIKIAGEDLHIAESEHDQTISVLYPTLSAFGYHTRYTESKGRGNLILQPEFTNEWGLKAEKTVHLSGRELTAFKMARDGIKEEIQNVRAVKETHFMKVAEAYYEVLKSGKAVELAQVNLKRLVKHRDRAALMLKVGETTRTVLLRAEAELAGSRAELIKAENALRISRTILARVTGIEMDFSLREAENSGMIDNVSDLGRLVEGCPADVMECLKELAMQQRNEIKSSLIGNRIAGDRVKYAKGAYWPELSVEAVYQRQKNDPVSSFGLEERTYAAFRVDYPFWEGGLKKAAVGEARARHRRARLLHEDLKNSIKIEVENAYLELITISGVVEQLAVAVQYSEGNYNDVSRQFSNGLADSVDVIDANTLLLRSERELASARYDYELAHIAIKKSVGSLLGSIQRMPGEINDGDEYE
ncbi:MAG: TolC family protein [Nitrospira sp.]|nr:TolC family protein [bacterium]MBL7048398.1 TolC family protein [Nitrospira sp.]